MKFPAKKQPSQTIAAALISWFDKNQRDLPWRKTRDPYSIWVSEVMLQQTQVATVIPYFQRFMDAFPSVKSLALADEQHLLSHWQGLGYYRRARFLHQAAKIIHADFEGVFPQSPEQLSALPGMGKYTCNAVLSQAFDKKLPILEANSKRVLARLFAWDKSVDDSAGNKFLWLKAEEILPEKNVGQFNQGLMELGSLVCTVTKPSCSACPLSGYCLAHLQGKTESIPLKKLRPAVTILREVAVAVFNKSGIVLGKRPSGQRWAGLWETPHRVIQENDDSSELAQNLSEELLPKKIRTIRLVGRVDYPVTRFRYLMEVFAIQSSEVWRSSFYEEVKRVSWQEISDLPMSSPQRRLLSLIQKSAHSKK